jgi:putative radical SAM enzyme (TIGR03279 family)
MPGMSAPRVVRVAESSPAAGAGLQVGDLLVQIDGESPRDVIAYRLLVDAADPVLDVVRGGLEFQVTVAKPEGVPLGVEVDSALFDQVRTCDNHCEFCFIHQLPPGLRPSLYVKDDDWRLSFLYGNFTTLTRFTEADLERVVAEGISPLNVSIHATDPAVRSEMLRNRRGGMSLRWLRALLDHGVAVHGQIVVCPGRNDGVVLDDTLAGILDDYSELTSVCVVPLGVSRFNTEPAMRPHTPVEAAAVIDAVEEWQAVFLSVLGRRVVFAADEYYLMANRPFPDASDYEDFAMHEDGVGMARTFEREFTGEVDRPTGVATGFFAWVDGAPAEGYRAPRGGSATAVAADVPIAILTGEYGARVLGPLVEAMDREDVRVVPVENRFFGGNTGVAGLLTGEDLSRVLAEQPIGHRYLLPDVCLSQGRFLDGTTPEELPRPVEIIATDGIALRAALETR